MTRVSLGRSPLTRRAVPITILLAAVACSTSAPPSPSIDATAGGPSPSVEPTNGASEVPVSLPPLPSGPDALEIQSVAGPFQSPLGVTNAGDGSGRLFVVEQAGRIWIVNADRTVPSQPFLDIVPLVWAVSERGLLGLAFHPEYRRNGRFFVNYTRRDDGATVIAEYRLSTNADVADPASQRILMTVAQPFPNHNGGGLGFGPDGYLYIALGDGGGQGDPHGNAQNPNALLGKILRIDVDGPRPAGAAYAIPAGNPYASGGGAPEVWALGLRNPWRVSFDRDWGDLYIGDVGAGAWEEINRQPADGSGGLNYGWPVLEGRHCVAAGCTVTGFVNPIAEYSHAEGCAVVGGHVYRGTAQPELVGIYVFGDWCSGRIFTLQVDEGTVTPKTVLHSGLAISSFGEGETGEIYATDLSGGRLYRVVVPD
jgi:glucose/arabinose dehydrogenase